jgi:hypothetical protein
VFIGIVRSISQERGLDSFSSGPVFTFDVLEVGRGEAAPTVRLRNGECDYDFEIGQSYIVYANVDRGERGALKASACSRTAPLSEAFADLDYIRALPSVTAEKRTRGWLTGTVLRARSGEPTAGQSDEEWDSTGIPKPMSTDGSSWLCPPINGMSCTPSAIGFASTSAARPNASSNTPSRCRFRAATSCGSP